MNTCTKDLEYIRKLVVSFRWLYLDRKGNGVNRGTGVKEIRCITPRILLYGTVICALHLVLFCQCTTSISGGGTDFPNTRTVAGRIVHENGSPAPFTDVLLLAEDYVPIDNQSGWRSKTFSTDSNGSYKIEVNDTGHYNLYAFNLEQHTCLLVRGVEVGSDDTLLEISDAELVPSGVIKVALPDSIEKGDGFIYIQGTVFSAPVNAVDQLVIIDSVPSGILPAFYITRTGDGEAILLQDSVNVAPHDTTFVAPQNGPNSLKLILNTTAAGADVAEDVYDFPLAIRFSSLPVNLDEFMPDGSDLVVTRSDNERLPFEIEMWDREHGEAIVWVKTDTVFGNNDVQSIYLFWGKPAASKNSAKSVFDTATGFSAVWHLNRGCTDATAHLHDGIRDGSVADTAGILGGAQCFHGKDRITIGGMVGNLPVLTLSAWAKLDTADYLGGEIISIGDAALIRMDDRFNDKGCQGSFYSSPGAPDTMTHNDLSSGKFLAGTGWHFFAYVYDAAASRHRFFIDGVLSQEEQVTTSIHYENIGTATIIGAHGNGKTFMDFTGCIDEVHIAHTARSAAWIKLSYMNQRSENRLVLASKTSQNKK
jgi:hypothetical protein